MASEIHYYRLGASRGENNMGKFAFQSMTMNAS
jgi:hypothetical protein